jgi:Holliday junction resolvase RusA-like endonuclease
MILLDLPIPPSVNRTRKINWSTQPKVRVWTKSADGLVLMAWAGGKRPKPILGRFEATIILSEDSAADLDNLPKRVLDYARSLGLITDDGPKYMRRIVIEFGEAPEGCRLILRPWKWGENE